MKRLAHARRRSAMAECGGNERRLADQAAFTWLRGGEHLLLWQGLDTSIVRASDLGKTRLDLPERTHPESDVWLVP